MRKMRFLVYLVWCCMSGSAAFGQTKLRLSKEFVQSNLDQAAKQIELLAAATPKDKFPKTFEKGAHKFSNSSWWCSGFFPGTLWYLYEGTQNADLRQLAEQKLAYLEKEKNNTGTHDLGFMLFCSFGNALRLTGDSVAYKDILVTGANSLASRFHDGPKAIKSWDWGSWHYAVIIDNMMNLELLTQISRVSGDPKFRDIAITHARTTMKDHFRSDYSSYHVVDYNPHTGHVLAKKTHQGASDESAWARGQGWALYGYTMMYRETNERTFLTQARQIAKYILDHPNLPEDLIPYWDFDMDKIPASSKIYNDRMLRDVSAAALYASALLELSQYSDGKERQRFFEAAETIISNLSAPPYKAAYGDNGGHILKHGVGALPLGSEVDVPLTYADYYYIEALVRYKRLLSGDPLIKSL